jgi:hypothetical protein
LNPVADAFDRITRYTFLVLTCRYAYPWRKVTVRLLASGNFCFAAQRMLVRMLDALLSLMWTSHPGADFRGLTLADI